MKISKSIAQKIVLEMMNVIPYNINVMDERGIIIGSGDNKRIGHVHEGAKAAIECNNIVEVYEESEKVKPGVNQPIIVGEKVIGVIGITGSPNEVRRFSRLVAITAVLLIEQSIVDEEVHNKKLKRQRFYNELAHRKTGYDDNFYELAKGYGFDLMKKYRVMVVNYKIEFNDIKDIYPYYNYYTERNNKVVFFINNDKEFTSLLESLKEIRGITKIAFGAKEHNIALSMEEAEQALEIGNKIKPSSIIYSYEELKFYIHLSSENKVMFTSLISNLDKAGNKIELIETLQAYIENNGDINNIANELKIHRNTLNYRVERIKQLTGKNPKNLLELFELICGLIWRE